MIPPFYIFRIQSNHLVWQGIAETLDVARLHIKVLMAGEAGDYIIRSQKTGHETIVKVDGTTERIA